MDGGRCDDDDEEDGGWRPGLTVAVAAGPGADEEAGVLATARPPAALTPTGDASGGGARTLMAT